MKLSSIFHKRFFVILARQECYILVIVFWFFLFNIPYDVKHATNLTTFAGTACQCMSLFITI